MVILPSFYICIQPVESYYHMKTNYLKQVFSPLSLQTKAVFPGLANWSCAFQSSSFEELKHFHLSWTADAELTWEQMKWSSCVLNF